MGSPGQGALKLLAVKVRDLKKKSATSAFTVKECARAFGQDSSLTGVELFSKFDDQ